MKELLRKAHWILVEQVGVNPIRLALFFARLPLYFSDLLRFRRNYSGRLALMPCLHDRSAFSGASQTEYFSQDLLVAQKIFAARPIHHIDVGSRLDGFIAHVASFREVTVIDIRPAAMSIQNVTFLQADLMAPPKAMEGKYDSISCLHTLEHFGLGRYGDPLNPLGYASGLLNMAKLLSPGGTFYLSVPLGRERVEFNAHRVFAPTRILDVASEGGLAPLDIYFVDARGNATLWDKTDQQLAAVAACSYTLGVFVFKKQTSSGVGIQL